MLGCWESCCSAKPTAFSWKNKPKKQFLLHHPRPYPPLVFNPERKHNHQRRSTFIFRLRFAFCSSLMNWSAAKLSSEGRRVMLVCKSESFNHSPLTVPVTVTRKEKHLEVPSAKPKGCPTPTHLDDHHRPSPLSTLVALLWTWCCGSWWDSSAWRRSWVPLIHRKGGGRSGCTSRSWVPHAPAPWPPTGCR